MFRNRAFRRLWLANLLSLGGSQVSRIGLILTVAQVTNSAGAVAVLVALETLPGALLAPLAGAVVDRARKWTVMVAADVVRCSALIVLLFDPTVTMMWAMAAVHSLAGAFFQPARAAAVPLVVGRDDLVVANSWDQSASNVMFIAGPLLGTELLLGLGLQWMLLVDAATFLASAALLRGALSAPEAVAAPLERGWWALRDVRSGWSYLRTHDLALHLSALFFLSLVCAGLWTPLAPFFIREHLGGTGRLLAWQFAAFGAGAVAGSALAPALVIRRGRGTAIVTGLLLEGVCQTGYAVVSLAVISTAVMFIWGVAVSLIVVPFYSLLQTVVDARFLGRVFSTVRQAEHVAMAVAMGLAALLQGRMDPRSILLAGGIAYSVLALASCQTGGGRRLLATR